VIVVNLELRRQSTSHWTRKCCFRSGRSDWSSSTQSPWRSLQGFFFQFARRRILV